MMPTARRMCFKAMNDKYRRQALVPFLTLADCINGWLVLFAVSKAGGSLFGQIFNGDDLLAGWKPAVRERLLRIGRQMRGGAGKRSFLPGRLSTLRGLQHIRPPPPQCVTAFSLVP
jgi:hypothetical protein